MYRYIYIYRYTYAYIDNMATPAKTKRIEQLDTWKLYENLDERSSNVLETRLGIFLGTDISTYKNREKDAFLLNMLPATLHCIVSFQSKAYIST